jgi:hypothetical protein
MEQLLLFSSSSFILKANKTDLARSANTQLFKKETHPVRQRASGAEIYACPVCKAEFKEKILLAIHIGTKH